MRSSLSTTLALLASFVFMTFPAKASGSGAEQYKAAATKAFYFLGEERFSRFECGVQVDALDGLVKGLKDKAASGEMPITLTENTETFALNFSRATDAITFTEPTLGIALKAGAKVGDEAKVERGLQNIRAGYQATVTGAMNILRGAFDDYQISRFATLRDVVFTPKGKGFLVGFSKDGAQVQVAFDGKTKRTQFRMQGQVVKSVSTYKAFKGKGLALLSAEMSPSPEISVNMSVDYARVKGLLVPSKFVVHSKQTFQGKTAENVVTIGLADCRVFK